MIVFLIGLLVAPIVLVALAHYLADRVSLSHLQTELTRVRFEAAEAERRLHDLTREAFVAMAEEADRRGQR